jgi:integrase
MSSRRQFGSVRKLPSGRWQAGYWHLGRRHIAPVTFAFKADANAYLSSVETEVRRGLWIDPGGAQVLFADWADEWTSTTVDLRPSSRVRDLGYLRRYLLPHFGDMALGEIDHMAVRVWVAELNASGLAPSTVTKAGQMLRKVMRTAVQAGLLPSSPCEGIKLPRIERTEMRFLTTVEVDALADAMDPRYRAAVLLAAYGGLRAGELFGLRAKRVDVLHRRIAIAETVVDVGGHLHFGPPKTRAGHRAVPLPNVATEPLGAHLATYARRPEDLVFTAPEGGPVSLNVWRRRFWVPALTAAGLGHLRPHDLRHTAVALWIAAGAHPKEVAVRAGHTSVSFTLDRYGHLFPGSETVLNDSLDELAREGRKSSEEERRARSRAIEDDSFAHVARTPEDSAADLDDAQPPDEGEQSGRCGTRTHDLSRVKAAL